MPGRSGTRHIMTQIDGPSAIRPFRGVPFFAYHPASPPEIKMNNRDANPPRDAGLSCCSSVSATDWTAAGHRVAFDTPPCSHRLPT
jgi:hypothetical protein